MHPICTKQNKESVPPMRFGQRRDLNWIVQNECWLKKLWFYNNLKNLKNNKIQTVENCVKGNLREDT